MTGTVEVKNSILGTLLVGKVSDWKRVANIAPRT